MLLGKASCRIPAIYSSMRELTAIKFSVESVLGQQGVVIALLDDLTVLHDENNVRFANGGEPVGDNKAGASLCHVGKSLLNTDLRPRVD